jgi:hypothetical protein
VPAAVPAAMPAAVTLEADGLHPAAGTRVDVGTTHEVDVVPVLKVAATSASFAMASRSLSQNWRIDSVLQTPVGVARTHTSVVARTHTSVVARAHTPVVARAHTSL